jgi:hypothetical protein
MPLQSVHPEIRPAAAAILLLTPFMSKWEILVGPLHGFDRSDRNSPFDPLGQIATLDSTYVVQL